MTVMPMLPARQAYDRFGGIFFKPSNQPRRDGTFSWDRLSRHRRTWVYTHDGVVRPACRRPITENVPVAFGSLRESVAASAARRED